MMGRGCVGVCSVSRKPEGRIYLKSLCSDQGQVGHP